AGEGGDVGDPGEERRREPPGQPRHHPGRGEEQGPGVQPHPASSASARVWRYTAAIRWPIVHRLARASSPRAPTSTATGAPSPTTKTATSATTRRSARSAIPPEALRPNPSARARA